MRHVSVDAIREALQARMQYEKPDRAFEVLYYGWRLARIHEVQKSAEHFHNILKRGWMDIEDARSFCNYCITGWEPPDD